MNYEKFFNNDNKFLKFPLKGNGKYCFAEIASGKLAKALGFGSGDGKYILCQDNIPCSEYVFHFSTRQAAEQASAEFETKRYIPVGVYTLTKTGGKFISQCVFDTASLTVVFSVPCDFKINFVVCGNVVVLQDNGIVINLNIKKVVCDILGRTRVAHIFDDFVVVYNENGKFYKIYGYDGTIVEMQN